MKYVLMVRLGTPPNCKPIPPLPPDCDVVNPPAVCPEPPICTEPECASTECPDGRIGPPGEECPDNPPGDDPPGDDPPGDDPPGDVPTWRKWRWRWRKQQR